MVADSGLFNPEVYGNSSRWQGQIADDSGWRDNISPGKIENPGATKGWGRRYKVRIMGIHDKEEESISSDQLPWAQVEMPITGGGGQAGAYMTPNLRQGMFVYGYFQDGPEQQVPIITGVLGHNATTKLKQKIGETDSNFAPTSGYAEGKVPKTYRTKEVVPKYDQVTSRPKTASEEKDVEVAEAVGNEKNLINQFGLKKDLAATAEQLKDITNAQSQADLLGLLGEAKEVFVKSKVHQELRNRVKRANSPIKKPEPGATCESADAPHRLNAGQVQREDKYREKIVVAKPDDPVGSSMKAMQTVIDNITNKIDKYQKAVQGGGYIDMVSLKNPMADLEKEIEGASQEMSKYMKVVTDKMMEFVNKTTNKELSSAVSAMPSSMRFMFADMKELTGQTTHSMYLDIGNNLSETIGPILKESLNVNNILDKAKERALGMDMLDINIPLPKISDLANEAIGVLDSVKSNVAFPIRRSTGKTPPPGVISGNGTKEDPWISPASEAQGDIPMPPQEVLLPPPPPPQQIPPLPEWIAQFGPEEGKIKYKEAKRGLVTSTPDTSLPPVVRQAVLIPPSVSEFSEQIVSNANSDGIADLTINSSVDVLTKPTVPICYAEDVAAKIIYANKKIIDDANNKIINNMNDFIGDMQTMMGIEQQKASDLLPGLEPGAIVNITDEEVLDQVRGGSNYLTAKGVGITFFKNIKPGITTSPGSGALVDITVSSGGLAGFGNGSGAQHFTWISQGTNYTNGNQNATDVDTDGDGTGMKINMVVSGGAIQTIFVHTIGTGYKVGDTIIPHMAGGGSSVAGNGSFKLDMVAGAIDADGIVIAKNGGNYQTGDVLKINGGGFDASFTLTAVNDVPKPKEKSAKKPNDLSGLLSKLNGIQGNLSKALNFENMKTNLFPFELPPNPAVSDFYQLVRGGAAAAETQLPSLEALAKNVNVDQLIPDPEQALSFVQPQKGQPNITKLAELRNTAEDLVDTAEGLVDDVTDTFGIG
tara:strand:+ start:150 stop:3119 length:2970 start_codon:yes stop_codon:yes gene_type:complete